MNTIEITSLEAPELEVYSALTEAQLRNRLEPEKGVFIAESPKVIKVALDAGLEPVSLLCEHRHIEGDARSLIERCPASMPVFTGSRELLAKLTGYTLTRGVLCAMRRPKPIQPEELCREARRIVVLHGVCDTTNVGAIFRSAAALGIDAVLMTRDSCDPLNRRAVRVSMGSVFLVPWTWLDSADGTATGTIHKLQEMGFTTAAMALRKDDISIDDPLLKQTQRLALIMGTEGDGLPEAVIDAADLVVKIPMHNGVDSLNVGNAAAIAFWELRAATYRT
ncbi:MAG: RNA methyltransferase [Bacteroidaceae bacterium]|nr:RNA methyltransferase [Bacteroidaceae bacterium]MBQ9169480.1 RNA methyltransferase [Bacteroidaceae bacterium]